VFIINALHRAAQIHGDRIASVHQGRSWTWAQVLDRVARLGSVLRAYDVKPGDRVAVIGWNTDRYLEAVLAVSWVGAVVVPLNTRLALPEVAYQVHNAGATLLIFDPEFAGLSDILCEKNLAMRRITLSSTPARPDALASDNLIALSQPGTNANPGPGDLMGIFYTGGTTGLPKGVMTTHANIAQQITCHMMDLGWTPATRYLHVLPMFHLGGLTAAYCLLSLAGCQHYMEKFDVSDFVERLASERITAAALSPVSIGWLLDSPRMATLDFSALHQLGYGTAPITEAVLRKAMERLPRVQFTQVYGQTEITGTISVLRPEDHKLDGANAARLRSAGRASWGVHIRVVNDAGHDVPSYELGEIVARSPGMTQGYWQDQAQSATALRNGWLHTGDIGYLDADGYLFVVDRKKDMIVTGGENVFSSEVENAIATIPGVAQVAVIGIPSDVWGEAVHAVVVQAHDATLTAENIINHCRTLIAGYKCPKTVEVRTTPLPLSGVNKIQKHVLRETFWRDKSRRVN